MSLLLPAGSGGMRLAIDPSAIESTDALEFALGPVSKDPANPLFGNGNVESLLSLLFRH